MIDKVTHPGHSIDVVVVHSLCRFGRDTLYSEFYGLGRRRAMLENGRHG